MPYRFAVTTSHKLPLLSAQQKLEGFTAYIAISAILVLCFFLPAFFQSFVIVVTDSCLVLISNFPDLLGVVFVQRTVETRQFPCITGQQQNVSFWRGIAASSFLI